MTAPVAPIASFLARVTVVVRRLAAFAISQADPTRVNPAESFAPPCPSGEPVVSADAAKSCPFTDAGLARPKRSLPPSIAAIPDDRLLTVADICALLQIRKSVVYRACDRSDLEYVKSRVPR